MRAALPGNETERLAHIRREKICSLRNPLFDQLLQLTASILKTPIAAISIIEEERQIFLGITGLDATETTRDEAFCAHTILDDKIMVVENAAEDYRFHDNPLVTGEPRIASYAGAPLITKSNLALGALCAIDHQPRKFSDKDLEVLSTLSRCVIQLFELDNISKHSEAERNLFKSILDSAGEAIITTDPTGLIKTFNKQASNMLGYKADEIVGKRTPLLWLDSDQVEQTKRKLETALGATPISGMEVLTNKLMQANHAREWTLIDSQGRKFPSLLSVTPVNDNDGSILGYTTIARDFTEQKQAALELERKQIKLAETVKELSRQNQILEELRFIQNLYLENKDLHVVWKRLLESLIYYTESEYGFIGEIREDNTGRYLQTHAITDISWNEETKAFYDAKAIDGFEFRNLDTLFGQVIKTEKVLVDNDPPNHPNAHGVPEGHPPLKSFIGIPILANDKMIAMVGLANRAGGYEPNDRSIDLFLHTYALLVQTIFDRRKQSETQGQLARIIDEQSIGFWDWTLGRNPIIIGVLQDLLGYPAELMESPTWEFLVSIAHPDDVAAAKGVLQRHFKKETPYFILEIRLLSHDKKWHWIRFQGHTTERDANGRSISMSGLHRDISDYKQYEEQQRILEANKNMIEEVHHRVKNNLQVVSGLLFIQERENRENPEILGQFRDTRARVSAIASLHEMLYRYRKATHVPVRSLIEGIMNNIRDVYSDQISRLEFQVDGPEFELDTAKADPLALIVNELITNAVKHAFEPDQPGVIQVLLERHDDIDGNSLVDITVSDNGKGLKTSTPGNDKAGIGLNLLGRLGEQLLGEVRLMDSPVGTQWKISFPE